MDEQTSRAPRDSCATLQNLRDDVDAFMADLLESALAVKREQRLENNAEAFDYTASFLSGVYRAMAVLVRDAAIAGMEEQA